MKSAIHKLFIRLKNSYPFSNKKYFFQPLRNIINGQGISQINIFKPKDYKNNEYVSESKINISGYSLLVVPVAAFILGTWQIQRYQWKLNLIDTLLNRVSQEPVELLANIEQLESMEYYPLKAKGTFLYDRELTIGYRALLIDGKPVTSNRFIPNKESQRGYHVITPFKLTDQETIYSSLTILVNRGWVPSSLKNPKHRQDMQIAGETEVVGIFRLNERRPPFVPKNNLRTNIWYYRDVYTMAEKVGASPIYLEMTSSNNMPEYPIAGQTKVELRNEHLSYIMTWYCLSIATAYMWYTKFIKRIPLAY